METIIQRDAVEQYKTDMVLYSIETNRRRAFPDFRDGFKIVHRRILFAMAFDLPCYKKLVKTAKVTGQVMGEYHPHGDSSIDGAIAPLCNWWDTYIPLIYSPSNMGSPQGDGPAASRYTEVMLSEFAKEVIFNDLKSTKNIVDWTPNYSGDSLEPEYLPVAIPLLLINGTWGLGTGRKTTIPVHNINEVIDATVNVLDNPDAPVVLIPDQCSPCEIIDTNWKQISNAGSGSFRVRGIVDIEVYDKGKSSEHYVLVVKSVPDMVTLINDRQGKGIHYQINELIEKGKLPQVAKLTEDNHDKIMRYEIHLKKGSDPHYVRDFLYKTTSLEVPQSVNFEALNGYELMRFSYKSYIEAFIEQAKITKFRKYCIELQNVRTTLHEKEICIMLIKTGKVDDVYKKIRSSKTQNDPELLEWTMKFLSITDLQAKFVLNYPLKRLTPASLKAYEKEAEECRVIEKKCLDMILNEDNIKSEIKDQLLYFKKKYGFPRKSRIISPNDISNIPKGIFNVIVTENNFIKKLPENENIGAYKGDNPVTVIKIDNTSDLIIFTAQGRAYKIPVSKIPITDKNSPGIDIRILLKGINSGVIALFDKTALEKLSRQKLYAVIVTENNYIKKLDLQDVLIATPSGIIMTKLNDGDKVRDVQIMDGSDDIIIYSTRKALKCSVNSIPNYKRNTVGVYAMNTKDPIDGIARIPKGMIGSILVLTNSGKVNRFDSSGLPMTDRYKSGSSVIKLGKGDSIHSIHAVYSDSAVLNVLTKNNKYSFKVTDIPKASSISSGTKLIPIKGDTILKAFVIE